MERVLYAINFAIHSVLIAVDVLIFFVAVKTDELRRHLFLWTIFLAMTMDVAVYLNTAIHDVPSFAVDSDIFGDSKLFYISILILCIQWFTQLFALLMLTVLHFIAVFSPARFRRLLPVHIQIVNLVIVCIGVLLSVPVLTPFCGYIYVIQGHYWYFDMSKPYTDVYQVFNLVLQVICAIAVACVDIIIIWKIYMVRKATKNSVVAKSTPNVALNKARTSDKNVDSELRLALNFVFLSVCFLIMTIVFNVPCQHGPFHKFLIKSTSLLNLSKWAIYSLGNTTIRRGLLSLLRCRHSNVQRRHL
ncbi:hypothetical protein GCK32_002563 [Trichostrongylus colubriformis]|uniref:7TM GPCR serpentine receptor class x (Srx) domain-containing protein n=1 Tax=Trichostrongylus colubriformis TaxID=6319 RepID=A0AAN8IXI1_TRICO